LTDITGVRSPDSIVRSEITSLVKNKVSVSLNSCIVFFVRTLYKFILKENSLVSRMQFISVSWSRLDIDIYGRRSIAIGRWCVVIGGWVCRRRSIIVRRIGRRRSI